jgi:hypothetical protein
MAMKKISRLSELLRKMEPRLSAERFFMAFVPKSQTVALASYLEYVLCMYRENEGVTIVFSDEMSDEIAKLTLAPIAGPLALITLDVYSDLMAVGFIHSVTGALAKERISVNVLSAYYHDHLLVPYERKDDAMKVLKELQSASSQISNSMC